MEIKGLAEKFENGSNAMNRMTKRTDTVVNGVLDLIDQSLKEGEVIDISRGFGYHWYLRCLGKEAYSVHLDSFNESGGSMHVYRSWSPLWMDHSNVCFLYEHLDYFISGMIATFPELEQKLQPFFKAAEYFEKTGH